MADKKCGVSIFQDYCLGVSTNRDEVVYGFDNDVVSDRIRDFVKKYNTEVSRYTAEGRPDNTDTFVRVDLLKWSRNLKRHLSNCDVAKFDSANLQMAQYRPFTTLALYLSDIVVDEPSRTDSFFAAPVENQLLCITGPGSDKPFVSLAAARIVDSHFVGSGCTTQCFPFYTYDDDGSNRRENITDWALEEFRKHYADATITKWDIFRYAYGLLHSSEYREHYAANLKRELPRIPYAPDFRAFAIAGERLTELHINYEQQPEYPLERIETPNARLSFRVEKMRLGRDKSSLFYNDFLTLSGVPPETYEYRLGNRSALEWVIDQYQVSTDKRSGITNDPNRENDPEYILRLVAQVIYVSLETVKIVKVLSKMQIDAKGTAHA